MNDINRKILLEADSRGFEESVGKATRETTRDFRTMHEEVSEIFDNIVQDNEDVNVSIRERLRLISREIELMERASRSDYTSAMKTDPQQAEQDRRADMIRNSMLRDRLADYKDSIDDDEEEPQPDRRGSRFGAGVASLRRTGAGMARSAAFGAAGAVGLASMFSIGGAIAKLISEGISLDERLGSLGGLTDRQSAAQQAPTDLFGLKQSDVMEYSKNIAIAAGSTEGLREKTREQLAFERSFGLQEGFLAQRGRVLRAQDESEDSTVGDIALEMLNIFKSSDLFNIEKGDFTLLSEKLDFQNQLSERQASQFETIDATVSTRLLEAFGRVGGSFADFRQVDTISRMNESIRNPQNDFSQAFLFRALMREQPDMSLLELMKRQEEGVFGEGNLDAILSYFTETFQGDVGVFNLSKLLGLNLDQAETLNEAYRDDPEFRENLKNITERQDVYDYIAMEDGRITDEEIEQRAAQNTGKVRDFMAEFDTKAAGLGIGAIEKFDRDYADKILEGDVGGIIKQVMTDVGSIIKTGLQEVFEDFDTKFSQFSESLADLLEVKEPVEKFGNWMGQRWNDVEDFFSGKRNSKQIARDEENTKETLRSIFVETENEENITRNTENIEENITRNTENIEENITRNTENIEENITNDIKRIENIDETEQNIERGSAAPPDRVGGFVDDKGLTEKDQGSLTEIFESSGEDFNDKVQKFIFDKLFETQISSTFDMQKQDKNKDNAISYDEMTPKQKENFDKITNLREDDLRQYFERIIQLLENNSQMQLREAVNKVYSAEGN